MDSPKPAPWPPARAPKSTVAYADEDDRLRHLAMAGWPLPGCEIRVVDLHMNDVPRDMEAVGEIVIRGDLVMDGYYKEPKATAAVMTDGWLHTGDMAVWDEENYIQIVDRKKDIIISGGENISSIEVERAIFAHPAVLECAVVSAPDPQWGEVPAAFVVLKPGQQLDESELCEFLQRAHRPVQNAARLPFHRERAAQDRHRQNRQARTARNVLGRQRTPHSRITSHVAAKLHARRRQSGALGAGGGHSDFRAAVAARRAAQAGLDGFARRTGDRCHRGGRRLWHAARQAVCGQ